MPNVSNLYSNMIGSNQFIVLKKFILARSYPKPGGYPGFWTAGPGIYPVETLLNTVPDTCNLNEDLWGIPLKINDLKYKVTRFARDNKSLFHNYHNDITNISRLSLYVILGVDVSWK